MEHEVVARDFVEGFKSHGTIERQSKEKFNYIIDRIRKVVMEQGERWIKVPYTMRIWAAQVR